MAALTAEIARIDDDLANAAVSNPKALEGLTRARAKTQPIAFSREEIAALTPKLQAWFRDEYDMDLGALPAEMLIDFLARELGPAFYNRALYDAQAVLAAKLDEIGETILSLEKR